MGWKYAAILPYFATIWAVGTYHAEPFGRWTIGWIMIWAIFSPAVFWIGLWFAGQAFIGFFAALGLLLIASPFSPDAATTFLTFLTAAFLGGMSLTPVGLAIYGGVGLLVGSVTLITHWAAVAHILDLMFAR